MGLRRGKSRAPNSGASLIRLRRGSLGGLPNVQAALEFFFGGQTVISTATETTILESNGSGQVVLGDSGTGTFLLHLPDTPADGFLITVKCIATMNIVDVRASVNNGIETNAPPAAAWGVAAGDSVVFVFDAATSTWWILAQYDRP